MSRMIFDILETNIVASIGIALLCLLAGKLRRRYSAGWMKLAWILLAVRLMIPYNFSMPFAGIRLLNYTGFEQERNLTTEDVESSRTNSLATSEGAGQDGSTTVGVEAGWGNTAADVEAVGVATGQAENPTGTVVTGESNHLMIDPQAGQQNNQGMSTEPGTVDHNGNVSSMEGATPSARSAFSYTNYLIKIWIAGVVVSLLYFLCSYLVFYNRCKKSLRPITNTRLIKEICRQQKKYIGHAKILVYKSTAVSSPMLAGFTRPRLILPVDIARWNAAQLELIMAHEMCHYRKKDLWMKMLMVAVCCVNWFNPMVYVMKKQFAYDMELACDGSVLEGRNDDERENYARIMLIFADGRRDASAFSTGFGESCKQMKARIDYMLDTGAKKKGILSIVAMLVLIVVMGAVVSCGYKAGEGSGDSGNGGAGNGSAADGELQGEEEQNIGYSGENMLEENDAGNSNSGNENFDYNHVYNNAIRCYQGDLYLAKEDGIYFLKGGQGEGELLYNNPYEVYRGMEIDGKYLYFCGSAPEGKDNAATVYRMDLDTHEVVETLAKFELEFPDYYFTNVSVYEGKLYVAVGEASERYGFALNKNGEAVSRLDQQAADYIYREYNEYMKAEIEWLNSEYDSEEYWELAEAQNQRYLAVIDVASCKKLLGGRQVVSQYKDELLRSIYLENEDGTYEHICDTMGFPMLVTERGLYYLNISGEIWYADFETKQTVRFYGGKEREWVELSLITYDADYIYLLQNKHIGYDMENNNVMESYLVRVPRMGGDAQKVYRFAEQVRTYGDSGWGRHCGVYDGRMYFDNRESFSLDPEENNMQVVNSGEPCADAVEITETARAFADAYFANDEDTLRTLLTEDFEERIEMYAYPEQAGQIREEYIGGMPDDNVAIGITCYVFYEFSGHAETGDALAYLSMEMTKTEDGFRVKRYEMEL